MSREAKLNPEPVDSLRISPGERPLLDKLRSGLSWGALGLILVGGTLGLVGGLGWPTYTLLSPELSHTGDTVVKIGIVAGVVYIAITHAIPAIMRATQGHIHRHP